jgi:hypothetical protein
VASRIIACVLGVSMAVAANAEVRRPRAGRATINGAEFFQLVPGKTWTLKNVEYPERVTRISVEQTNGGPIVMRFEKNHPDTYHGADGTNNNLIWFVTQGAKWIRAGNSNGDDGVGDAYPDDIRVSRETGREVWRTWLQTLTPGVPACYLVPTGDFTVPSSKTASFRYYARNQETGWEGYSLVGTWRVRWDLVTPDVLRIRFDESYAAQGGAGVFEDWYLRRGHGLIRIDQWYDSGRTQLRRGIAEDPTQQWPRATS